MNGSRFDQTCKEEADSAGLPLFPEQQDPSYPQTTTTGYKSFQKLDVTELPCIGRLPV